MTLKIEKEAQLLLLRKELAGLNSRTFLCRDDRRLRQVVIDQIAGLERELVKAKTEDYPIQTRFSPPSRTHEHIGKVVSIGGKRKFVATEPKQYQPLKGDTVSGYGEKRKRYS